MKSSVAFAVCLVRWIVVTLGHGIFRLCCILGIYNSDFSCAIWMVRKKLEKSLEVVPEFLSQHRTSFQEVIFLKDS